MVRAPLGVAESYIEQLISRKRPWILAKLQLAQQNHLADIESINQLKHGGLLWSKGVKKQLNITFSQQSIITEDSHTITVTLKKRYQAVSEQAQQRQLKKQLELWFKQQLEQIIEQRFVRLTQQIQLTPSAVKIRRYKARWGSCDNRGLVSFNYLLAMVPDWVIDYVIIHELCHLKHLNHSADFWRLVERYSPNYQDAKHWLKQHQAYLIWPCKI
ncbi:hypothetical protein tinsulaeT_27120 [Thalassotalea insulae]|uniref:YgjP-like metallopeptidase domain-containing protein n=1 Tax=Thalassotalea insulae TaxID=2056778 RepID=A0ABQ6GVH5_9GAMM|nr:hypothetical protein tinsulaeT_27120 [Thalassotalea insulae]